MLTAIKIICPVFALTSAFLLLAVEDATLPQITTLILTFLTTTIGSLMAYKMAQMNKVQTEAKAAVEHVIEKVGIIEKHTNSLTEKAVAQAEEKGKLAGAVEERDRATVEAGVLARGALAEKERLLPRPTAAPDVSQNVEEVKGDVKVVKQDVKDVKTEVVKEVKAGVQQGVTEARKDTEKR